MAAEREDGPLLEAFRWVQERKQATAGIDVSPETAEQLKAKLSAELPSADAAQVDRFLRVTLQGAAWIAEMVVEHDLSFLEAWSVAESLAAAVREHEVPASPDRAIDLGVGAGFYTGLWVAFRVIEERAAA